MNLCKPTQRLSAERWKTTSTNSRRWLVFGRHRRMTRRTLRTSANPLLNPIEWRLTLTRGHTAFIAVPDAGHNPRRRHMANSEVTKSLASVPHRMGDAFGTMRNEMDKVFERFENGWPRRQSILPRGIASDVMVPELDVHENGKQLTIPALTRRTSR